MRCLSERPNDLDMALRNRPPSPGGIVRADHGVRCTLLGIRLTDPLGGTDAVIGSVGDPGPRLDFPGVGLPIVVRPAAVPLDEGGHRDQPSESLQHGSAFAGSVSSHPSLGQVVAAMLGRSPGFTTSRRSSIRRPSAPGLEVPRRRPRPARSPRADAAE